MEQTINKKKPLIFRQLFLVFIQVLANNLHKFFRIICKCENYNYLCIRKHLKTHYYGN